ncbi:MAG: zinc ribbon domain-containing protein [Clostridia bacterium]|nr:zinc ribbon domain-containing protein [Clostridia bacterium]
MISSLKYNPLVKALIYLIVGVLLFQILFGLVFNGSATGAMQSLILVVVKLVKLIIYLALFAGILMLLEKFSPRKGEEQLMNLNREQVIKGVVIVILALVAFALLSNLFNGPGAYSGPGYYAGEGVPYGYNGGSGFTGLLSSFLSLLITLMALILVASLAIGAYKVAWPHLNAELANFINSSSGKKCVKCVRELSADWQICPYCGSEAIPQGVSAPESPVESSPVTNLEPAPESQVESELAATQEPVSEPAEKKSYNSRNHKHKHQNK